MTVKMAIFTGDIYHILENLRKDCPIELVPDPPARLSEEERLFSKQKLQKLKMFARLEKVSLPMRHY